MSDNCDNSNNTIIIEGTVEEIIFSNESNGFTVCDINYNEDLVTAVGYMPYLSAGETVKLTGQWSTHIEYGEQLKVKYYEKILPSTATMILKYLSSGVIKGIRESTAKKIIEKFGEQALEVIENTPRKLSEIKGISVKKADEIGQAFFEQSRIRNVVMFLQQFGVTPNFAIKAYKRFGNDTVKLVKSNPYILSDEITGISFRTVDKIATSIGIELNSVNRIKAGIRYILSFNSMSGHTCLPKEVLIKTSAEMLRVSEDEVSYALISLLVEKLVISEKYKEEGTTKQEDSIKSTEANESTSTFGPFEEIEPIYLTSFYNAEKNTAFKLLNLSCVRFSENLSCVDKEIESVEEESGILLTSTQKEAVRQAVLNGVLVITGGPGTGKTTIINTIIKVMERLGYSVALAAPTGRASKRMAEMTGKEARTLHRLLEIGYIDQDEDLKFAKNEDNPLDVEVVIIDETSMVDILLMNHLLKAISPGTRLILVGDADQLPSVGPGCVLSDIIKCGRIKVIKLQEIFRQARESMIIVNAHRINRGEYPEVNLKNKDFYHIPRERSADIVASLIELVKKRLPDSYGYHPAKSIQILTPMRKTPVGVINLNEELQRELNPPHKDKAEKEFRGIIFRVGDKVMQIKNNYNIEWEKINGGEKGTGVFNGDVGIIELIDNEKGIIKIVLDDEKKVIYDFNHIDELELAYALTVHKSQGSEFPVVVIPVFPGAPMLMSRNLFYTAVTRARELVVLVGRESVIKHMVDNNREIDRYSGLGRKLRGAK